jgi:hypothetical protein
VQFGSAAARRRDPELDSSESFSDFIDYNLEAKEPGFHSTFVVAHRLWSGLGDDQPVDLADRCQTPVS